MDSKMDNFRNPGVEDEPEMPITGLRITDVIASGKGGVRVHHTDGLELRNVEVTPESGPVFVIQDSKNLKLDNLSTRMSSLEIP
jgi:hypothetical protein